MTTHIVSVGGGITSTLLLPKLVIEKYGRDNVKLVMAAVANDEPNARTLVEAAQAHFGMPVDLVTIGEMSGQTVASWRPSEGWHDCYDIWDVFFFTGRMGSTLADPCSRILKREVLRLYVQDYTPADTVLHVGVTYDEIDRMVAIGRNWLKTGYTVEADLANDKTITRAYAVAECRRLLRFVPELYEIDASHNNCGGFCVKAGHGAMARLLWHFRERFLYHERQELLHQQVFNHPYTIMRDQKTRNGLTTSTPLTLRAFRLRMEARWKAMLPGFDPFDGLDETPGCRFCDAAA